jgi:hypothetical protein
MHLWNDYEGKTIAEAYPLEKLLRPEGRSAFFATKTGTGTPNIIRLTESLNDEHEMLERWRQVSQVHQENLVAINTFGQTTFDGVPLAYALMEPTDANLAEILAERPLTAAETREVAVSLVAALAALHDTGLVHEHIEPSNVLASGEVIKLRSDCVRECAGDPEFTSPCEVLKQRDIHDLGLLLLRCLTLEKQWNPSIRLPAPFQTIIPRAIDGTWGLQEIAAALQPTTVSPVKPLVPEGVIPPRLPASDLAGPQSRIQSAIAHAQPTRAASAAVQTPPAPVSPVQESIPFPGAGTPLPLRRIHAETAERSSIPPSWLLGGAVALGLLMLWFLIPSKHGAQKPHAATPAIQTIDDAPAGPPLAASPATRPTSSLVENHALSSATIVPSGWRVVCYTFNREDLAWTRVAALRKTHNSLHPGLFAPSSKGPYLVTIGGVMTESQAETLLKHARRSGLPRDTFTRFYPAR